MPSFLHPSTFTGLLAGLFLFLPPFTACAPRESAPFVLDATPYFPLDRERWWILFDDTDQFLTIELSLEDMDTEGDALLVWRRGFVGREETEVIARTILIETATGDIRTQGTQPMEDGGEAPTWGSPVLFLGKEMEIGVEIQSETSVDDRAVSAATTLEARGTTQTYFGAFPDSIKLVVDEPDGSTSTFFLAEAIGPVKISWHGTQFQLYDYGFE